MGDIKISFIIPTFRPHKYLWKCLDSICGQSLEPSEFEIIVILNGDKEPYYSEINNYISQHSINNWNLLYSEISGVSNARNLGLDHSLGEYITFVDDDDFVSPHYLTELKKVSTEFIVGLSYPLAFEDGTSNYEPFHITKTYDRFLKNQIYSVNQTRSFFSGPVYKLIHKSIIKDIRFDSRLKNGEDTLFMFQISPNIKGVKFCSKEAVYYRRYRKGSASLSNRSFDEHLKSNSLQLREYITCFLRNPLKYNFSFFITRCGGSIYDIVLTFLKSLIIRNRIKIVL